MIMLIALRLPVLGFCLCENHVIVNDGNCCPEVICEQSTCDSCPESKVQTGIEPCSDCVVVLSLDPGDFQWSAAQFSPAEEDATPLPVPVSFHDDLFPKATSFSSAAPIRGSPPLGNFAISLRTQVLRL